MGADRQRAFFVGVDLGQMSDYTAICVIEAKGVETGKVLDHGGRPALELRAEYQVRHLERPARGTPYPAVVKRVRQILSLGEFKASWRDPVLAVDASGVGRAVVDMFVAEGVSPVRITIHGGDAASQDGAEHRVPKRDIVGVLQATLQTERLKVRKADPLADTFVRELQAFKVKVNPATAHDSYEAREGEHDDLVLAVGIAIWTAERVYGGVVGWAECPAPPAGSPAWYEAEERRMVEAMKRRCENRQQPWWRRGGRGRDL